MSSRLISLLARCLGIAAAALPFSSCYLLNQGATLLRYQSAAEPVDTVLRAGRYSDGRPVDEETRAFLGEVEAIRSFAGTLGLAASSNYTSIVPIERDYLADVVNATDELSFARHEWWWPAVGKLPYKGFYKRVDAERLADRLRNRGLDVWVRRVDAFSTLGVLSDPLYEFMAKYDRYTTANLILHERAHASLFLRGHAQFNEEFATFVGDTGAELYLQSAGAPPGEYQAVSDRAADRETARILILELRSELDQLYRSRGDPDVMRSGKADIIARFQSGVRQRYETLFRTESYRSLSEIPINNAFIDLYVSYTENLDFFREIYARTGDLAGLVDVLAVLKRRRDIPRGELRKLARKDPRTYIRTTLLDSAEDASVE